MTTSFLLAAAFVGPLPADTIFGSADTTTNEVVSIREKESLQGRLQFDPQKDRLHLSRSELRELYTSLIRKSSRSAKPDPYAVAPQLIDLFNMIPLVERTSHAEKQRMQRSVKGRLQEMAKYLARDERKNGSRTSRGTDSRNASLAGPAEIANARQLINLIQRTIAPDSWDVNGGKGSIFFYSPLNVLVIRATGGVQGQVGDTLGQLR